MSVRTGRTSSKNHNHIKKSNIMKNIPAYQAIALMLLVLSPAGFSQVGEAGGPPVPDVPAPSDRASAQMGLSRLIAIIRPVGKSNVSGSVVFEKTAEGVQITAKIGGLNPESKHAFHIHEFGDLGSDDATSAGDHFNPDGYPQAHGLPAAKQRHAGDLGNLQADADGNATLIVAVKGITLDRGKTSILGRAVIVHAKPDDGSQPAGNAGSRIGAGVIGISKDGRPGIESVPLPNTGPGR
jgi:Cu-Zn family superoxide dismutase